MPSLPSGRKANGSDDIQMILTRADKVEEDTAFSRRVEWLNSGNPIPRSQARCKLISRLKVYQTCVDCSDLNAEINSLLEEIREGKIENFGFERLHRNLFNKMGAAEILIVPRSKDNGSDLIVDYFVFGLLPIKISVQAKHWNDSNPVGVDEINQLRVGMEKDGTDFGLFITSGTYSEAAYQEAQCLDEEGTKIRLVDGMQLGKLLLAESVFDIS